MTDARLAEIRKANGEKKHGHPESAVRHCAELLEHLDVIEIQMARMKEALKAWVMYSKGQTSVVWPERITKEVLASLEEAAPGKE